jgi:hypothetical protein
MTGTPTTTLKAIIRFGVACPASGLLSKPVARKFFTAETQRHGEKLCEFLGFEIFSVSL